MLFLFLFFRVLYFKNIEKIFVEEIKKGFKKILKVYVLVLNIEDFMVWEDNKGNFEDLIEITKEEVINSIGDTLMFLM